MDQHSTGKRKYGEYVIKPRMTSVGLRFIVDGPAVLGKRIKERSFEKLRDAQVFAKECRDRKAEEKLLKSRALKLISEFGSPEIIAALEFAKLEGLNGQTLYRALRAGLGSLKKLELTVEQAWQKFQVSIGRCVKKRKITSSDYIRGIERRVARFVDHFGKTKVADLEAEAVEEWLERLPGLEVASPITPSEYNHILDALNRVFNWLVARCLTERNPIKSIDKFKLEAPANRIELPSVERIREFLHFLESYTGSRPYAPKPAGFLVPHFVMKIFLPIRPVGEFSRADVDHMFLIPGEIDIDEYTSKTNQSRVAPLRPNFEAWARAYPLTNESIRPRDLSHELRVLRKRFGFTQNIFRKLYVNAARLELRSIDALAKEAGNSPKILRRFYLTQGVDKRTALIFDIYPKLHEKDAGSAA